ncbi:MAG: CHAP domain-containing protein, partial [Actinomycetes bacterium]
MARFLTVISVLLLFGGLSVAPAQAGQSSQTTAERIVAIAQQELAFGVHEIPMGSNKGTRIKMYGLATQEPLRYYPAAWCAYFTSWVTQQAGAPIGWNGLGDGLVSRLRDWGHKTGLWRTVPQPGDLIAFPEHIGIVESIQPNGLVTTIEGNTGDAVRRRLRLVKSASGFIRVAASNAPVPVLTAPSDTVYRTEPV